MKILVMSHTEHYLCNGKIVGWGPTVRELDFLASSFGEVIHLAFIDEKATAPMSSIEYKNPNVTPVLIPKKTCTGLKSKLLMLFLIPRVIYLASKYLNTVDFFQLRVPTGIGIYMIPYLNTFRRKNKGWYKYAGNWSQKNPPLTYWIQRIFLTKFNERIITVNGRWPHQPANILPFENPCLEQERREAGFDAIGTKSKYPPYSAVFAGRLEDAKGVRRIIQADKAMYNLGISKFYFIGDGPNLREYKSITKDTLVEYIFTGFLSREGVQEIMLNSHFFFLPTVASEGFPKVIAEAANFGCIPIVSNVSSIPQYINEDLGFVWNPNDMSFDEFIRREVLLDKIDFEQRQKKLWHMAEAFTFSEYCTKLKEEVLK